jgi:tRNA-specific 2-thiouridylase
MDKIMDRQRVLVGMSGGVDSTATCLMLLEQGYEVVGVTMRTWDNPSSFSTPNQEEPDYILEARALADRLGIEHYVADERDDFRRVIVQNFIDEYMQGRTPNPCVMCNPLFKFRVLSEWADKLECDYIATGHYSRLQTIDGRTYIIIGNDAKKDQSYFLWRLGQEVLGRLIFPLGKYTKGEVRAYLKEKGFEAKSAEGESMEICFIDGDYRDFLRQQVPDIDARIGKGKFVDAEGHSLGIHRGFPYYTIGQRKGLEIALGKPAYVIKLNPQKNTVMLGNADELKAEYMLTESPLWVNEEEALQSEELTVRIRYRSQPIPCRVYPLEDGRMLVQFLADASAVTPGQSAVFYIGNRVVGGAFIANQKGVNYVAQTVLSE